MAYLDTTGLNGLLNALKAKLVPVTRRVNNKALTADISITAADVGAVSIVNGKTGQSVTLAATDVGAAKSVNNIQQVSGNITLTAASIGAAKAPVNVNLTLTAGSWTTAGAYTVSNSNILTTSTGDLSIAQNATADEYSAWAGALPQITGQTTGSITITARGDVPTVNIPVTLVII